MDQPTPTLPPRVAAADDTAWRASRASLGTAVALEAAFTTSEQRRLFVLYSDARNEEMGAVCDQYLKRFMAHLQGQEIAMRLVAEHCLPPEKYGCACLGSGLMSAPRTEEE